MFCSIVQERLELTLALPASASPGLAFQARGHHAQPLTSQSVLGIYKTRATCVGTSGEKTSLAETVRAAIQKTPDLCHSSLKALCNKTEFMKFGRCCLKVITEGQLNGAVGEDA